MTGRRTAISTPTPGRRTVLSSDSAPWIVGLMVLAAGSGLLLRVTAVEATVERGSSVLGVLGIAVLLTLLPALFIAVGAGVSAPRRGFASVGRWLLVLGLAAWSSLCILVLGYGIHGGAACGGGPDPCGGPLPQYAALIGGVIVVFAATWALSVLVERMVVGSR